MSHLFHLTLHYHLLNHHFLIYYLRFLHQIFLFSLFWVQIHGCRGNTSIKKRIEFDIDDELISVDSANRQNGKNAYQTIGVSSLETYGLNSKIAENTYSAYVLAMKQTDTKSLEELMETLLRMKKYDWAYSKIKSVNDREQYNLNYHN